MAPKRARVAGAEAAKAVKRVVERAKELKRLDLRKEDQPLVLPIAGTTTFYDAALNYPAQGSGGEERAGTEWDGHDLQIRGWLTWAQENFTAAPKSTSIACRIVVVEDRAPTSTVPALTECFKDGAVAPIASMQDWEKKPRFKVLADRVIELKRETAYYATSGIAGFMTGVDKYFTIDIAGNQLSHGKQKDGTTPLPGKHAYVGPWKPLLIGYWCSGQEHDYAGATLPKIDYTVRYTFKDR